MSPLSWAERALLAGLCSGAPEGARPYAALADHLDIAEPEVIESLRSLRKRGIIRRMAGIPDDRLLGYGCAALAVWRVPPARLEEAGAAAAACPAVVNACARRACPEWPYNLYTMVRARSEDELDAAIRGLAAAVGADEWMVLRTVRRLAKRSPRYPCLQAPGGAARREVAG